MHKRFRSKSTVAGAVLLLLAVGYYLASPYVSLLGLKSAITEGDAVALESRIDFPHLRSDLNSQLTSYMLVKSNAGPLGSVVGEAVASRILDGVIERLVAPSGLAALSRGAKPTLDGLSDLPMQDSELFADARLTRDAIGQFSVWIPRGEDVRETRFVFAWSGLSWKLSAISLQLDHSPGE